MTEPDLSDAAPVPPAGGALPARRAGGSDTADVVAAFTTRHRHVEPGRRRRHQRRGARAAVDRDRATWTSQHASGSCRDHDGSVIGQVSLHHLDLGSGNGEIGYWMVARARGRGIGAACVDAATRYAFDVLELHRVELFHAVENEASCRLALRCGYAVEGTLREAYEYGDGVRHDEHLHARLRSDPDPGVRVPR
jgi:RimJ/RimL family protein N-acetyltransferase